MRWIPLAFVALVVTPASLHAQTVVPKAITGTATSARHCVSANAANAHYLGWVPAQSLYTVQFDADFPLVTGLVRMEPAERRSGIIDGTPEFNSRASSSGTLVLLVRSSGPAGCYRYKVTIDPAASFLSSVAPGGPPLDHEVPMPERPSVDVSGTRAAITGNPSSAQHCVSGRFVSSVHELGRVDQDGRVTINVDGDFDFMLAVTGDTLRPDPDGGGWLVEPASGGTRSVSRSFPVRAGENLLMYVQGFNGAAGCYTYQVTVQ